VLVRRARLLLVCVLAACHARETARHADAASSDVTVHVRVPGALRVARALDTLTVEIDPAASVDSAIDTDPSMSLGVETETRVFAIGSPTVLGERHGYASGATFDVGQSIWNERTDGLPEPGKKYVAEMKLVLFETDVPPGHMWNPHAGRYKALLTRTIRQAEE
jgi:hypothetical protein